MNWNPRIPLLLLLPPTAAAATRPGVGWYVDAGAAHCPGGRSSGTQANPFCAIQDAVNAASSGDTIHIAPGTYFENVLIDKKELTLIGTGGREVTILDGMGSGSVVRVRDTAATLTGLTLTGGTGTFYDPPHPYAYPAYFGGGLFAYSPAYTGDQVLVLDCDISGNSATWGGGLTSAANTELLLVGSSVLNNATSDHLPSGSYGGGGGVAGASSAPLTILDSIVSSNRHVSSSPCSLYSPGGGWGGGIAANQLTLTNSTVDGNAIENPSCPSYPSSRGFGGGIYAFTLTVENSSITNNSSSQGGGVFVDGQLEMTNCTVANNRAFTTAWRLSTAGGVHLGFRNPSLGVVRNSVFWGNRVVYTFGTPASIRFDDRDSSMTVDYSLVEEGWFYPSSGNRSGDPLFIDPLNGDYRLLPGSPCIDAGDNTAVPPGLTTDLRGAPRFLDDLWTPDTGVGPAPVVDMGAYEFFRRFRDARGVPVNPAPPRSVP